MDNPATSIPSVPLQPNVESTVSSSAESPAGPKNPRWLLWLLGSLITLVLGIAAGLFSAKFLNQSQLQSQLPPTPTLTPSPSTAPLPEVDPTANWEIYTNNIYKFSFKYPSEWQLSCTEPKDNNWLDATICQLTAPNTQLDHGYLSKGAYVAVGISKPTPKYSSLKEYVTDSVNRGYMSSPKTYNNVSGYLLSPPESPKTYSNFVFESKGYIININWVPIDENNQNYSTIDQILSTFKFLD